MRPATYVGALALAAGIVAWGLWARNGAPEVGDPVPSAPAEATEPRFGGPATASATPSDPRSRDPRESTPAELRERIQALALAVPQERTSSRRGRSRNRYPGPIPTPAEWVPPEGPVRIALQAGHWRANEAPPELSGLRDNGTRWEGMLEWEANLEIARRAGAMLEDLGYVVDVLPAIVPPDYRAHLFISIHSDGSNDPNATGFRVAAPRQDATGRANGFVELLERSYGEATGLPRIPSVTRRMQSYYAFNYRRYEHALHPMTIGVIIETGFLTSAGDRRVIVEDPDRAAQGIVEAVKAFSITPPPGG